MSNEESHPDLPNAIDHEFRALWAALNAPLPDDHAPEDDELFPGLHAAVEAANALILPEQDEIKAGDWVYCYLPDAEIDCIGYVKETVDRGFLYGCWYTDWVPEGEWGDNHRSIVMQKLQPHTVPIWVQEMEMSITLRGEHQAMIDQAVTNYRIEDVPDSDQPATMEAEDI